MTDNDIVRIVRALEDRIGEPIMEFLARTMREESAAAPAEVQVLGPVAAADLPDTRPTGQKVREAMMKNEGGFTIKELASDLGWDLKAMKVYLKPMLLSGVVRDTGQRFSGQAILEFVKPEGPPVNREHKRPPEKEPPAGLDARATGMPVRIRTEREDRRKRSTPGARQKVIQRDRAYERQEAAKKARAAAQAAKDDTPKWAKKKRGSKAA